MKYGIDFHEDVASDYLEAYTWYEDAKVGLDERFLKMVRAKLEQIEKNPEAFSQKTKSGLFIKRGIRVKEPGNS